MAGLVVAVACNQPGSKEASPSELLAEANTKLRSGRTSHMEGTGTLAVKAGATVSFDLKLRGDAELPGKSRVTTELSLLGQSLSEETITIDGRTFTKNGAATDWVEGIASTGHGAFLDPLGQLDLTGVVDVTEIDRPQLGGRETRHLRYTVDPKQLLRQLLDSPSAVSYTPSSPAGSGEVWIATDDGQILRQIVAITFDIEPSAGSAVPSGVVGLRKARFEAAFDLKFTLIGQPVSPAITAPPVATSVPRS
jgi:hypothetical protein